MAAVPQPSLCAESHMPLHNKKEFFYEQLSQTAGSIIIISSLTKYYSYILLALHETTISRNV